MPNKSSDLKRSHCGRIKDPYLDRRQGDDRRQLYSLYYFQLGGLDRRRSQERRFNRERRKGYARVSTWASVCLSPAEHDAR